MTVHVVIALQFPAFICFDALKSGVNGCFEAACVCGSSRMRGVCVGVKLTA